MKNLKSVVIAFIIFELLFTVGFVSYDLLYGAAMKLEYVATYFLLVFGFAFAFSFCVLLPTLFIVNRFWKITWYVALIVGLFVGLVVAVLFFRIGSNDIDFALLYGSFGAVNGIIFWFFESKQAMVINRVESK